MKHATFSFLALVAGVSAFTIPGAAVDIQPRQACPYPDNPRACWGDFSIDTNWYETTPPGRTVEYWLSAEEGPCQPDGYRRHCMTFNGTIPGPTIIADWGDTLIIHVTNNMVNNGTAIHWHGVRHFGSLLSDGVPGVTQCPIAPGQSMTYRYRVTQYGSGWYHSHFSLQYSEGLFGGIIFNGPATADYDEDLGSLFLQDWSHRETFELWNLAKLGPPPILETGLVNGSNTWDCSGSTDPDCVGGGVKHVNVFESGKKYRFRLINNAVDGVFQFSIDGHNLTVIANDFVPIVPFTASSVQLTVGQRYDVIVEANADPGNYWLRAGWVGVCMSNGRASEMTGIIRYDASSTSNPTSVSTVVPNTNCLDEPEARLVPHLSLDVTSEPNITRERLAFEFTDYFKWTINTTSLRIDWKNPTILQILNNQSVFPTPYNVVKVDRSGPGPQWVALVIEDQSGTNLAHPIHLHGHDFWVLAQETGPFDGTSGSFDTSNPPRRDVATLPPNGYLAIAFQLDNPGAWLVHCHIAWHASQGLSLEFVEDQALISIPASEEAELRNTCRTWELHEPIWPQDDSGI